MSLAPSALRTWKERPGLFVRQVLHAEPDAWQDEVLEAAAIRQRIALKSSKGPGKSTLLAWLGWWFLTTRLHPKVVATSITGANLKDGLWTELSKWQQRSDILKEAFSWSAERIVSRTHPETWWASARQWSQGADTAQQADTLAGIHADAVMFLVDEAGGIPDAVVAAAEAGLANADPERGTEAKLVLAGNPTHLEGPLYRACTRERALWWVKEISGDPDDPKRAPRVSVEWAREQIAKYGRDNPWVLVNVFGQFPPGQSNALLGVEEVTRASQRTLAEADYREEVKILGVDIARFGDDRTVIMLRQGRAVMKPKVYRNLDTMQVASEVAQVIEKQLPDATFLDAAGYGAGVVDRLKQLGYPARGVDFGGTALTPRFTNRRSEMWWKMTDWVKEGGCIPDDGELISELTAPTYKFDDRGRLLLEKKAELKKRIGVSPDKADALALTFAEPVASRAMRNLLQGSQKARAVTDYDPYA